MSRYCVVDASVSLKWALDDEEAVAQAVALRNAAIAGRLVLAAPSLWLYEVTNGLVTAVRRRRLNTELGCDMLGQLLKLGIRLADPDAADVYTQAVRFGIAAYDAAYVALAEVLAVPLWTGDRRLYETVRGRVDWVRWIGDYESAWQ